MKLFLSSYHWGNYPEQLAAMSPGNRRAFLIFNALDFSQEHERKEAGIRRELSDLASLGFETEQLDLRDYFGKSESLRDRLEGVGLLWVAGGNTFVLRRAMRQSGLDQLLVDKKHQDTLVYAGYSAGSCVVTPTLRGIDLVDDPNVIPKRYDSEIIWEGLSLVPYSIAPHYRSNHPESERIEKSVEYFIENKMLFKAIHDGEVLIEEAS